MRKIAMLAVLILLWSAAGCGTPAPSAPPATTTGAQTATAAPAESAAPGQPAGPLSTDEARVAQYAADLVNVPSVDFTLTDLGGKQWKLSDLKGKLVLLNFWATWCGPCQMEMPHFQKLYDRFGADGDVVVLAVASSATENAPEAQARAAVEQFIKAQGFTFPVPFDADGAVWGAYQQEGIPANYLLDRQGNVRLLVSGAFANEEELYAALEAVRRADNAK